MYHKDSRLLVLGVHVEFAVLVIAIDVIFISLRGPGLILRCAGHMFHVLFPNEMGIQIWLLCNFKAPYAYGYDVNEYDEYGNPKVFSKHEERDDYGNLKGKTVKY